MGLIIDTSILIAAEKKKLILDELLHSKLNCIASVTLTELLVGMDRVNNENKRIKCLAFIEYVKSLFTILPFGIEEAYTYSHIIHYLYKANITIGTHDMLIAATAITHGYSLLTLNVKDFKKIQGLEVLTASSKD
ncbi:MAG: PIN domain-containing protein [Rickettsia endosymbiont of Glossina mortisans submortisans]|nr:PIN domain-containing protein [Rickettsia endosymbiont of Glossina mortisans submortisans]